jgi:transposase
MTRALQFTNSAGFPLLPEIFVRVAQWIADNEYRDVCMESTGKYWIPVYNILESTCKVVLAHPKYVKAIRGKKTNTKDAKWIADIFKHDLVSGSFTPPLCHPATP